MTFLYILYKILQKIQPVAVKNFATFIKNGMEKVYNDELLPEDFEEMAKAYSANLKNKGFVFVKLFEEEKSLLIGEILVLFAKMKACLHKLQKSIDGKKLFLALQNYEEKICEKFKKNPHNFVCVENENNAFLSLISAENMLLSKLFFLSCRTDENEFFYEIIFSISAIFSESFSLEGFLLAH